MLARDELRGASYEPAPALAPAWMRASPRGKPFMDGPARHLRLAVGGRDWRGELGVGVVKDGVGLKAPAKVSA